MKISTIYYVNFIINIIAIFNNKFYLCSEKTAINLLWVSDIRIFVHVANIVYSKFPKGKGTVVQLFYPISLQFHLQYNVYKLNYSKFFLLLLTPFDLSQSSRRYYWRLSYSYFHINKATVNDECMLFDNVWTLLFIIRYAARGWSVGVRWFGTEMQKRTNEGVNE